VWCSVVQIVNAPAEQNDTAGAPASAPVDGPEGGTGAHPLARAVSCPPPGSSPVVTGNEPEPKRLKSIIKKTVSNGNTSTQSGDVLASGDTAQASDYTKQTSVSSKSSGRRAIISRGCCIISWLVSRRPFLVRISRVSKFYHCMFTPCNLPLVAFCYWNIYWTTVIGTFIGLVHLWWWFSVNTFGIFGYLLTLSAAFN